MPNLPGIRVVAATMQLGHDLGDDDSERERRKDEASARLRMLRGEYIYIYGSVSKPCTPVVHIKIAGKWMFIPLKMVLIGIDPYPYMCVCVYVYM